MSQKALTKFTLLPRKSMFLAVCLVAFCLLSHTACKFSEVFHVVSALQNSGGKDSIFRVTKQMVPSRLADLKVFSFVFEWSLLFDSLETQTGPLAIFDFEPGKPVSMTPSFSLTNSKYQFSSSDATFALLEFNSKKLDSSVQKTLFFAVNVDRTTDEISLVHLSFANNENKKLPPKYSETVLAKHTVLEGNDTYFSIHLPHSISSSSTLRNLVCLDHALLGPEKQALFGGIASLKQSYYLYMEPAHSKIFHNRSAFNYPPALNGSPSSSLNSIYSTFSEQTGHTEWLFASNRNEYAIVKTPLLNLRRPASVSLMLSFELLLLSADPDYLETLKRRRVSLLSLCDADDNVFLEFWFVVSSEPGADNLITLRFRSKDEVYGRLFWLKFDQERLDASRLKLSPVSLTLSFIHSGDNDLHIRLELDRSGSKTVRLARVTKPLPPTGIDYILVGDRRTALFKKKPIALVNLFDVQLFEGSAFFRDPDDSDALLAVSKLAPHIARCASNRYPNRLSQNSELDAIYSQQLASVRRCSEFEFNRACTVPNCEVCGDSECLVCKIPFVSENSQCVSKAADLTGLGYDVFSRNTGFGAMSGVTRKSLVRNSETVLETTGQVIYGRLLFDIRSFASKKRVIPFDLGGETFYFVNSNSFDPAHSTKFNFPADVGETYFFYQGEANPKITVRRYALSVEYVSVDGVCSSPQPTLASGLKLVFCPQLVPDFSRTGYLVSAKPLSSVGTLEPQTFLTKLVVSGKDLQFISDCRNNCDCGASRDPLTCATCPEKHYPVPFAESSVSCEPCESDCLINCTSGSEPVVCESARTTGKVKTPHKEACSVDCDECVNQACKACSKYPHNHIFRVDLQRAFFVRTNTLYCQSCRGGCLACASESECHCVQRAGHAFAGFSRDFNSCKFRACPDFCAECDGRGACTRCQSAYRLSNQNCILSRPARKNCIVFYGQQCLRCKANYYSDSTCVRCPSNCARCSDDPEKGALVCAKCLPGYRLSPQFNCFRLSVQRYHKELVKPPKTCPDAHFYSLATRKCTRCARNCLLCEPFRCLKCRSPYFPVKSECALCGISNCESCPHSESCLECLPGHFFDSTRQECLPCPANCVKCVSSTKCVLCEPSHSLWTREPDVLCAPNCRPGLTYFDPDAVDCLSCFACKFCAPNSACSSCGICRRPCETTLTKSGVNQYWLASPSIDFTSAEVEYLLSGRTNALQHRNFQDRLSFVLDISVDSVFSVRVRAESLKTFACSVEEDIWLELPGVSESSILTAKGAKFLHSVGSNAKRVTLGLSLLTSVFSLNSLIQSLVYLSSVSSLYSYTLVSSRRDRSGLSGVIAHLNKMSVLSETVFSPLSRLEAFCAFDRLNEFGINYVSLNSYQVMAVVAVLSVYFLCYQCTNCAGDSERSREWFRYFLKSRMDRQFMKSFFQRLRSKTSAATCNQIVRFLRSTKRKIRSSRLRKFARRSNRFLRRKRHRFVFLVFCLFHQELAHLSVKSVRYYFLFPGHKALLVYCWAFHFISGGILFIVTSRAHSLNSDLPDLVNFKQESKLEEYFDYVRYLGLNLFSFFLVYVVVLSSGRVPVELCVLFLFVLSVVLGLAEKKCVYFDRSFLSVKYLVNMGVMVSLLVNSHNFQAIGSVYSDFVLIALEVFCVSISVYSIVAKLNQKWTRRIETVYKASG